VSVPKTVNAKGTLTAKFKKQKKVLQ